MVSIVDATGGVEEGLELDVPLLSFSGTAVSFNSLKLGVIIVYKQGLSKLVILVVNIFLVRKLVAKKKRTIFVLKKRSYS